MKIVDQSTLIGSISDDDDEDNIQLIELVKQMAHKLGFADDKIDDTVTMHANIDEAVPTIKPSEEDCEDHIVENILHVTMLETKTFTATEIDSIDERFAETDEKVTAFNTYMNTYA